MHSSRPRTARLTRRLIAVGALATAAVLALAGCGASNNANSSNPPAASSGGGSSGSAASAPSGSSSATAASGSSSSTGSTGADGSGSPLIPSAKKSGGTLTYALDSSIYSLDANLAAAAQDARILRQIYDSLLARKPDGTFVPWLATKWSISSDGLTYTFTLRSDVKFQDGTAFNAAAVCFNFDRIANPANGSIFAKSAIGPYKSCSAPNTTTAIVTLSQPYAPFLAYMTSPFLGMVSPTAVQKEGKDGFAAHPVGSGPFEFVSYVPNQTIVLKRNPDYNWANSTMQHQGPAYLDGITFQFVTDPTVRVGDLQAGQVQAIGAVPPNQAVQIEKNSNLITYVKPQSGSPFEILFNTTKPGLNDPVVRTAMREALDVKSAVQSLFLGVYQQAWSPLAPTTQGYDASLVGSYGYDVAAANAALDKAGWVKGSDGIRAKNGVKLSFTYLEGTPDRESRQELQTYFVNDWKAIGVQVTPKLVTTATSLSLTQNNNYDIIGLSLVNPDPGALYEIFDSSYIPKPGGSGYNLARVNDSSLNTALSQMMATTDVTQRMSQVDALQKQIIQAAYSVPIYVPTYVVSTTKNVTGVEFDNEAYPIFYDTSLT